MKHILPEGRLYVANHVVSKLPSVAARMWFYRHVMGFDIASSATIFLGARFHCAGGLYLGDRSVVNENCRLDPRGQLTIENDSILAAEVTILTADHDPGDPSFQAARVRPVRIGHHVFVGTRAMILAGVSVGDGAVIGAGSVVTRSVPAYSIVAGSPARIIGKRPENVDYSTYYRRLFH